MRIADGNTSNIRPQSAVIDSPIANVLFSVPAEINDKETSQE